MKARLNKKKIIINVIITAVVLALTAFYLTRSKIVTVESIRAIKLWQVLLVLSLFAFALLIWSAVDFLVYRTVEKKPLPVCYANLMSGNLGSNVTPLKSGHFPLMAYYLNCTGMSLSSALTAIIKCQIIYDVASTIVYAVMAIVLGVLGTTIVVLGVSVKLYLVALVGVAFHVGVSTVIVLLSFCTRLQAWVLNLWTRLVFKFKKTGSPEEYLKERQEKFRVYREQITVIFTSVLTYIPPVLIYTVHMLFWGSGQYLSYLLISGAGFSFSGLFTFFALNLAQSYITNLVPIPGGVGASELLFTFVYAAVIPSEILGTVLILWRLGSYYAVTVLEAVLVPVFLFRKRKKTEPTAIDAQSDVKSRE